MTHVSITSILQVDASLVTRIIGVPAWLERRLPRFNIERPEADDEAPSAIEDERETVYR